ncbi:hypothetical protein GCM10010985_23330 [Caballeronia grimmiae]|uniref:Transposase n=1 Tax=Caballeronia grimmiae TaxID=1071679 RepID=A0ABQ1RH63_9BURK|nr:hypothetical protein GCM10010985_23330 [Caballeronia grimmiae]
MTVSIALKPNPNRAGYHAFPVQRFTGETFSRLVEPASWVRLSQCLAPQGTNANGTHLAL